MFWKNVGSVLTGTAMAQAIPLLGSLLIARLYLPESFGEYSAWLGLVLIFSVFATLRLETSIAVVASGYERRKSFYSTLLAIIIMVLVFLSALVLCKLFELQLIRDYGLLLAALVVVSGAGVSYSNTWQSLVAAEGEYKKLSIFRISQALIITVFQIIAGWLNPTMFSLVIAHFIGLVISVLIGCLLYVPASVNKKITISNLFLFIKEHKKYPVYSLPADSMNSFSAQLPIIVMTARFGAEIGGMLALAMKTLGAPIGLLGKSVLDVFKRYASDEYRQEGNCERIYKKTFVVLTFCSIIFVIFMYFSAEWLFELAFGSKWVPAAELALILLPLFMMRFIASPLSYVIYIAQKQHYDLLWQVALLVMTISALYAPLYDTDVLRLYSGGYALLYSVYLLMTYKMSRGL